MPLTDNHVSNKCGETFYQYDSRKKNVLTFCHRIKAIKQSARLTSHRPALIGFTPCQYLEGNLHVAKNQNYVYVT